MCQKNINIESISINSEDFKKTVSKFIPIEETKNFIDYFESLPNKQQAWIELLKWILSDGITWVLREEEILENIFQRIPDRQKAWDDLIKLISEETTLWVLITEGKLGNILKYVPDKQKSWEDLIKLTSNKNEYVRWCVSNSLGESFQYVPDKQSAWEDLIKLVFEEDKSVREKAAEVLGKSFQYVPCKQKAWDDLIELTSKKDSIVRWWAAEALGKSLRYVPNKQKACDDLIKLVSTEDMSVKWRATIALGNLFQYMPEEQRVLDNLTKLSLDNDQYVRILANHSLGRISIYRASVSKTDENYMSELKKAINFFEKASSECVVISYDPSYFCLSFYKSFYAIISVEKQQAKDEVDKYLLKTKNAIKGSKNKKLLFESIENLANALKKVQDLETMNLRFKTHELNLYREYCDRAEELMRDTEKTAPTATKVMRRGSRIFDRKLKSLLEEIQEKAKTACRESQGTDTEEIACAVSREVQNWEISSQEEMTWNVENLIFALESSIPRLPANQHIFDRIQQIREQKDIPKQYGMVSVLIPLIPKLCMEQKIDSMEKKLDDIIIHFSESHTDLTISLGIDFYGNGMKVTKTIPLQKFSDNEKEEMEEKIKGNKGIKLSSLSATLINKIKGHFF